jgi:hypothetical protein
MHSKHKGSKHVLRREKQARRELAAKRSSACVHGH